MRKLLLQMQTSVDGFVAASQPDVPWQLWDFSDNWTWDDDLKHDFNGILASIDCILLSRNMIEGGFLAHWETIAKKVAGEPQFAFARKIADVDKVVVSRTLETAPWPKTTLAKGDLIEQVSALKRQRGKDILCFGGAGLASALVRAGLVDEFQFFVNPSALGEGRSIFGSRTAGMSLELRRSRAYSCGIVVNRYAPAPVRLSRSFAASAESLFDAWLKPDLIKQWMFSNATHRVTDVHSDPRPGGTFSITGRSETDTIEHSGEYLEIERPQRIVFTLQAPKLFAGVSRVAVHIERAMKGSVLTFTQTGVDKQVTEGAWREMFDNLAGLGPNVGRR